MGGLLAAMPSSFESCKVAPAILARESRSKSLSLERQILRGSLQDRVLHGVTGQGRLVFCAPASELR